MSNRTVAMIGILIFVSGLFGGVVLEKLDVTSFTDSNDSFSISVDDATGTNQYTLVEIDEGDNDEEAAITWVYHEFVFDSNGGSDAVTWDFADGTTAAGSMVSHMFKTSGVYIVTATSIGPDEIKIATTEVTVDRDSAAEVDNMECVCAPTAKDTVIDLFVQPGFQTITGFVEVEHDGSSESCSLRNPLQECHLRVILQYTQQGEIIGEEVLFDETFRSNEQVVDYSLEDVEFTQGQGLQLRLETDQVRDWHKPNAQWSNTAPIPSN